MAMRSRILLLATVFVLVLVPTSARASLPYGFIGISPQNASSASDFRLMSEAGVTSVRLPLYWLGVQAQSPNVAPADWSSFDRQVELAAEADISIFPFVWGTPSWAAPRPIDLPVRTAWQRWGWTRFLREAVTRYGTDGSFWQEHPLLPYKPIRRWEIWNEENIVTFASPPSPRDFATLVRMSGTVLHGAEPGSKVILGGFFGRPLQIPPNVASGDYLSRLYRARNVKRYFDGVALHPYVAEARAMGAQIVNLRRIMRLHHDNATPIYVTELGWGSRNGPTRWERGLWGQANQLSKAFGMLSAHRRQWNVGGAWWFTWTDEGGTCLFCRSAGLLTARREAKPAWYRFTAWTGGDAEIVPRARFGLETGLEEEAQPVGG